MPDANLCEIIVVLDRSGSMTTVREDTIGGFNSFVEEQKKIAGQCILTLVQFDSVSVDVVHEAKPIADVPGLVFEPRGGTPLLDAVGRTIKRVGERYANAPDERRPGRVIFAIITDGEENSSHEYTLEQIRAMIQEQTEKWKWEFTFLGAGIDSFAEAGKMGIPQAATANMSHDSYGTRSAYGNLSKSVSRSRIGGQSMGYTQEERDDMEHGSKQASPPPNPTGK